MNLYHVMFDLKDDAKATTFAHALDQWMALLVERGTIRSWRLLRRKLALASGGHRDFLLEVEVADMAELDRAFRLIAAHDDEVERRYAPVHAMIAESDAGLYRPFPDPERAERVALL
ncbi:MAG: DUF6614 family protein [Pseudomonadota bacterium]